MVSLVYLFSKQVYFDFPVSRAVYRASVLTHQNQEVRALRKVRVLSLLLSTYGAKSVLRVLS